MVEDLQVHRRIAWLPVSWDGARTGRRVLVEWWRCCLPAAPFRMRVRIPGGWVVRVRAVRALVGGGGWVISGAAD